MNSLDHGSTLHLKQRHFPFGIRELVLNGTKSLTINERSLFRKDSTEIPLEILQSSPAYSRTFSVKWLLNSLVLLALGVFVYWFAEEFKVPLLHILTILIVLFVVYAIYQFFVNTSNLVIYRNAYTNEHYLYLWRNSPNKKKFEEFIQTLDKRIDGFEQAKASSPAEKIELYSQHLSFLHKEKIIDDKDLSRFSQKIYEKALEDEESEEIEAKPEPEKDDKEEKGG